MVRALRQEICLVSVGTEVRGDARPHYEIQSSAIFCKHAGRECRGRWPTSRVRRTCVTNDLEANYHKLDIRRLARVGALAAGCESSVRWSTGEAPRAQLRIRACDGQLHFRYGIDIENGQRSEVAVCVGVTWTVCNYGGRRPWFLCPRGGLRAPCHHPLRRQ